MDKWVKPAGKTPTGGMMSGKQARQYAQNTKMCKHSSCNNIPGNHQFKFPGAKDYCTEHARLNNNKREAEVAKRVAKRAADRAAREQQKQQKRGKK